MRVNKRLSDLSLAPSPNMATTVSSGRSGIWGGALAAPGADCAQIALKLANASKQKTFRSELGAVAEYGNHRLVREIWHLGRCASRARCGLCPNRAEACECE